jgi:eukaryotic-like serine/threonine-protein kinase
MVIPMDATAAHDSGSRSAGGGSEHSAPASGVRLVPVPQSGDVMEAQESLLTVRLGARVGSIGAGTVFTARTSGGDPVTLVWLPPGQDADAASRAMAALIAIGSPHRSLAWPICLVRSDSVPGWGWVTRLVSSRVASLTSVLAAPRQPSFRVLATIGVQIAEAFGALRAAGLTYRGFDLAGLLADPVSGEVVIPVTDSVGILGVPSTAPSPVPFPAPELVRGEALPSAVTDMHSLAVLLFFLLVHGHPLEGIRTAAAGDPLSSADLSHPLFVFDPADPSNVPPPGDPMTTWWPIYPAYLRALFTKAFTAGLTDLTPGGRVTERQWHSAMVRLASSTATCSCGAAVVWDPDEPGKPCWSCGSVPPRPTLLELPEHTIVLAEGAFICPGHLSAGGGFADRIAVVEADRARPGGVVLRNVSDTGWKVQPAGQRRRSLAPGLRFRIRAADVDFGPAQGTIVTPASVG